MKVNLRTFKRMVCRLFVAGSVSLLASNVNAQALTGTKSIPGNYSTIAAAVADLNTNGVGPGGVTFNISAGHTETISGTISLTATGTLADQIVFQKNGVGANPLITAHTGTNTPGSATQDGIFRLVGSDYVTIDGIDLLDPNTTNPATMEYGYSLYKASLSDGAQRNTIKNCVITLSNLNNASGSGPAVDGSRGIDIVNATPAAATTALSSTARAGTNSYNKIYSNIIKNCNIGISVIGFAASSPFLAADTLNDIGGSSLSTGNMILNFGGAASAANPSAGIRTLAQYGLNVSFNTLNNNDGTGANHVSTLRGIFINTATSASANINNNTITLKAGATTSAVSAIENASGGTAASNTININNNTIQNCDYLTATTATLYGIYNTSGPATLNMNGNTLTNWNYSAGTLAGSGIVCGIYNTGGATTASANNNSINTINRTGTTGASTYGIYLSSGTTQITKANNINGITVSGGGTAGEIRVIYLTGTTVTADTNTIYNISNTRTTGTGAIHGIYNLSSPTNENYNGNIIHNLIHAGAGSVTGITNNTAAGTRNVSGNTIYTLSAEGATVSGITQALSSPNVFNNRIYDLTAGGTAGVVNGITVSSGTVVTIYNNLIGDLKAPAASAADAIRGINLTTSTSSSSVNVYYNTVYLNASSTGTNFGTSGIYHAGSTTSTTAALNLRNNIIVNTSTPAGTGLTVAYRRSSTSIANYAATSNNNLFYAGTPGASNLIFSDGTNNDQTLSAFKTRMATRDQGSISESPVFVSTSGSNAAFLDISTSSSTQIESGAVNIPGFTKDISGTIRAGNPGYAAQVNGGGAAPDLGAREFDGLLASPSITSIGITPAGYQCTPTSHTVSATITPNQGSITSATLNYAFNGVAQTAIAMVNSFGSVWEATIPAAGAGELVTYSITAVNSLPISKTENGKSYFDVPTPATSVIVSATPAVVCSGSQTVLRATVALPNAGILGAGALSTTGSGTSATLYISPFDHYYGGIKTQYLFKASELTASGLSAGNILSLALDVVSAGGTYGTFAINMAHTALTAMTTTMVGSGFTQVYSAASHTPTAGINTYNFSTPFVWDGTSNVVVQFCWSNNNTGGTAAEVRYDQPGFVCESYYRNDNTPAVNLCPTTAATGTNSARPKMIFRGNTVMPSYSWSDGSTVIGTTNPLTINPTFNSSYTVTITDTFGCVVTSAVPATVTMSNSTLSGIVPVGAGQTYTTLTSAINAYNTICNLSGAVVFELTDAVYGPNETFPIVIQNNLSANATNNLTIRPAAGNNATIIGRNATSLIQLKGADYITIDGSNNGTNSRNLTLSNDTAAALCVLWITSNGLNDGAANNVIKNTNINGFSSSTSIVGIGSGSSATLGVGSEFPLRNNRIENNAITKVQNAMYLFGNTSLPDSNWVITGNTLGSATVVADRLGFRGMLLGSSKNFTISKNRIIGVTTGGTGAGAGIFLTGTIDSGFVSKNVIADIKNSGAYPAVGIYLASSSTNAKVQVDNNAVSDVSGTGSATLDNNGAGIVAVSGGGYNIYFNSVNMVSTQTTGSTTAMYITSGITGANSINIRNNSFANNSTSNHTRYAIYNAAATTVFADINYNNYFTRGTDIGYSTSARTTIADWRTATGKDVNSISSNPIYARASNLIPDLGSPMLGIGTPIAGLNTDIVDSLRSSTPSIGAYEKGMDLTGPTITFNPLPNTTNQISASLSGVTITDFSGVNATSGTKPRIYYKKRGEANVFGNYPGDNNATFNGWKYQESTSSASPFDFNIDYSLLTSAVSISDTIQYFVVAQDLMPLINVGANPLAGFSATSVDVVTAAPTTPLQYIIIDQPMTGPYTVGTGGNFLTLSTAAANIQLRGLQGDVELDVISDIAEAGAVTFTQWNETGAGNYKLLIRPTTPAIISGNSATGLVVLSGADRVTIDGRINGTGNNLTISNTSTAANSIGVLVLSTGTGAGCVADTIRNVNIQTGSNTAATTGMAIQGDNNNRIAFIANVIKKAQSGISVTSATSPAGLHQGLYIAENMIGDTSNSMGIGRIGISLANAPASVITRNVIYNINDITSTLNYGIQVGSNSSRSEISRNRVDSISNGNTGGWSAFGINISGSDTLLIANNIITRISLHNYSTSSTTFNPFGLRITSGSGHKVYYNTVNMFGNSLSTGTAGTLSAAFLVTGGSNLDVRNNVFVNSYVGLSGSQSFAIYSTVANTSFKTINSNNYYSSGTYAVLGYLGANRTTLAAWRTASGQDLLSTSANPVFASNNNLNIASAAAPSLLESGAEAITEVTVDFNGDIRPKTVPTTYGGNLGPDMGAYEFDGTPVDLNAPVITYTTLANANTASNRTLTATIVDNGVTATGVNTTSGTMPRIYYKKSVDNNTFGGNTSADNGWKWTEATNMASPFSFTIDYSLLFGGAASNLDTIQYFVTAQDNAGTPNVSANPVTGFAGTSVGNVTAAPTTPNKYIISLDPPLNGVYQVGAAQTLPNFVSITQAVAALALRGASGPVTFELTDAAYAEAFPIEINPYIGASALNTLTIKPASGINSVISGTSTSSIFKLNGADFVTIEGSNNGTGSRNLTIENTSTSASTAAIWMASAGSGAKHNTVKNCVIRNGSITVDNIGIVVAGAAVSSTGTGDFNDSLLIENNDIQASLTGIYVGSPATGISKYIRIKNNLLNSTSANALGRVGISVTGVQNLEISGNEIGGFEDRGASANKTGIYVKNNSSAVKVFNNKVSDLVYSGTSGYAAQGIIVESSATLAAAAVTDVDVYNNFISGMQGDGDSYVSFGSVYMPTGIYLRYTLNNVRVLNNTINLYGSSVNNDAESFSVGIALDDNAQATVYNNIIVNKLGLLTSTGLGAIGIFLEQGASQLVQSNYNNFVINASTPALNYIGKIAGNNYVTLSDWRTATGKETNSRNVAVTFVSNTDLHLGGASNGDVNLVALPIAGLTLDIDGNTRSAQYPYMGADEASNPIPVKLLSLNAVAKGGDVLVSWSTASETNNKGFDVERSVDGKTFSKVDFVKGAGNSNRLTSYNLKDANAFMQSGSAVLYYRLRQHDFNGNQAISDVVMVTNKDQVTAIDPVVYPNPFNTNVQIQLVTKSATVAQLQIFDISGKAVLTKQAELVEGANALEIDKLADLERGVYFISISFEGNTTIHKMIKN